MNATHEMTNVQNSFQIDDQISLSEFAKTPIFYWILFNAGLLFYFIVTLSIYEYWMRKVKLVNFCKNWRITIPGFNSLPRIFCWISSFWLFSYWFHMLVIVKPMLRSKRDFCTLDYQLQTVFVATARLFLVLVLWFRQRSFYTNVLMKNLSNKFSRVLSSFVGIAVILVNIGYSSIFVFAVELRKDNTGKCVFVKGGHLQLIVFQYMRFLLVGIHIVLTGLFLAPLLKKHTERKAQTAKNKKSDAHIKQIIVRSFVVSVFYVVVDLIPFFLPFFKDRRMGRLFFAHTSMTIPFLLTNFIFGDWKIRMFPWMLLCTTTNQHKKNCTKSNISTISPHCAEETPPESIRFSKPSRNAL